MAILCYCCIVVFFFSTTTASTTTTTSYFCIGLYCARERGNKKKVTENGRKIFQKIFVSRSKIFTPSKKERKTELSPLVVRIL
jgi:hypothetical protein